MKKVIGYILLILVTGTVFYAQALMYGILKLLLAYAIVLAIAGIVALAFYLIED